MRITGDDQKEIFAKYVHLNEDLGLGPKFSGKDMMRVTTIGNDETFVPGRSATAAMKGSVPSTNTPSPENNEEESCDEEAVDMAKGQLLNLADKSIELFEALHNGAELESWVASKILLASDYITTVSEYMTYNKPNQEEQLEVKPTEIVQIETEDN